MAGRCWLTLMATCGLIANGTAVLAAVAPDSYAEEWQYSEDCHATAESSSNREAAPPSRKQAAMRKNTDEDVADSTDCRGDVVAQTHLDSEPTAIANHSVNVISGLFMDSDVDLIIPGAEPMSFRRCYASYGGKDEGAFGKGWHHSYAAQMNRWEKPMVRHRHCAQVMEPLGASYLYTSQYRYEYQYDPKTLKRGVTNCGQGALSAQTNIKNNQLDYTKNTKQAYYRRSNGDKLIYAEQSGCSWWPLVEEHHPSRNKLIYSYSNEWEEIPSDKLASVTAFNHKGLELAHLTLSTVASSKYNKQVVVKTSLNSSATYHFTILGGLEGPTPYLSRVERASAPNVEYGYGWINDTYKMTSKRLPNGRQMVIRYYDKGENQVGGQSVKIKKYSDPRVGRVSCQLAPVGTDDQLWITHRYFYKVRKNKSGFGEVLDTFNNKTTYYWNKNQRLTDITRHSGHFQESVYTRERFFWDEDRHSMNYTNLMQRAFEDSVGNALFVRSFKYDLWGNVVTEKVIGNLSGYPSDTYELGYDGIAKELIGDCQTKKFTYYWDNLRLMSSSSEGDKQELYSYVAGSNLLAKKLYLHRGKIYKREFYFYDVNGVVIKEIIDDGSAKESTNLQGVTERHVTITKPTVSAPVGLPEEVTAYCVDLTTGKLHRVKRVVNSYTPRGRLKRQEVYDSTNQFAYALTWSYNAMGKVLAETDAMGNVTTRKFDANSNKIYEKSPYCDGEQFYTYDYANRLIKSETIFSDGVHWVESYSYDRRGSKISSTDRYGQTTKYQYDKFKRLVATTHPAVPNSDGVLVAAQEWRTYDLLDNPNRLVDGNGNQLLIDYTIRGQPFKTVYPDGTTEECVYNIDGSLNKKVAKNGSYTVYQYDAQGRTTATTTYSSDGTVLSQTSARYSTFHLLSETDAMGEIKSYSYDLKGRLIREEKGDSCVAYTYDTLGRIATTTIFDGQGGGIVKRQTYDLQSRVVEEKSEQLDGTLLGHMEYSYDSRGNRVSTTQHTGSGTVTSYTSYDARNSPYQEINGEGHVTSMITRYDYCNEHGQNVAYSSVVDPLGNSVVTISDVAGRIATVMRKNRWGEVLQKKEFFYDCQGNKRQQIDTVFSEGRESHCVITKWSYNSMGEVLSICEAAGTPEQKTTSIVYNRYGQKERIVKPDGVAICHRYDALGRLKNYFASDESFSYRYHYDANNNITSCTDRLSAKRSSAIYDRNGRLVLETLGNGLTVGYSYDGMGRPTKVVLPSGSAIEYLYEGDHLQAVNRLGGDGMVRYRHTYDRYDLTGKLLAATLVGKGGQVSYSYDHIGRALEVGYRRVSSEKSDSPGALVWRQEISQYDDAGNILAQTIEDPIAPLHSTFSFDDLYQLTAEEGLASHSYCFDSLYNRIAKDGTPSKFNRLNQLLKDESYRYQYDANGNLICKLDSAGKVLSRYKYDALNRLVLLSVDDLRVAYSYDGQNRRLTKEIEHWHNVSDSWQLQSSIRYLYVGENEIGSYTADGTRLETRILGTGKGAEIGAAIAIEIGGIGVYAPVHDSNGNVCALLDSATGDVAEVYRYTAFGESMRYDGLGNAIDSSLSPWGYASKRFESESGYIFFGRRYYDPVSSRWITPDPIGFQGGPNLYAYLLNSPLTHFDLYGLYGVESNGGGGWGSTLCDWGSSFFSAVGSAFSSFAHATYNAVSSVGSGVRNFCHRHFVERPAARQAAAYNELIQNYGHAGYKETHKFNSCHGDLGMAEPPGGAIILGNGMNCSFRELINRAFKLSQKLGGYNVHYCYNSSQGTLVDCCEWICQRIGIKTHSVKVAADCVNHCFDILDVQNSGNTFGASATTRKVQLLAHSQFGEIADYMRYYVKPERCQQLDIATFGSARLIRNKGAYASVLNYISNRDMIPFLGNPLAYTAATIRPRHDVIFLPSRETPFVDHAWDSQTYQTALDRHLGIS